MNTESSLTCFRQLAQTKYFAKAIAHAKTIDFARWPIFNIGHFAIFGVFSNTELLQCEYRIDFDMGNLKFWPKLSILQRL